ncbi:MAG: hypothetical protein IJW21_03020 [Clostridia bacterium]|nr:hypothetical protein [Clostridia bacterium]
MIKTYTDFLTVGTPDGGDIRAPLTVTMEEKKIGADVKAEITLCGKKFEGRGTWLDWGDAFAALQKSLPGGYSLKCCLACRHGNMWIYGRVPNLIFCMHGKKVDDKDDLIGFFGSDEEAETERKATDVCENFAPQSKDFYTYNDYLYCLEGKIYG